MRHSTHKHTQPFYGFLDFILDNPGEPVPEETFTNSHPSWSSFIPYLPPPSIMIHGILSDQFTCLSLSAQSPSKFSLVYLLAWYPPLHTQYISSPKLSFFATHAHTIATYFAVVPRLCHLILVFILTLYLEFYLLA